MLFQSLSLLLELSSPECSMICLCDSYTRYRQPLCHFKGVFLHCQNKVARAAELQHQITTTKITHTKNSEFPLKLSFSLCLPSLSGDLFFSRCAQSSYIYIFVLLLSCIRARLASTIFAILLFIWYILTEQHNNNKIYMTVSRAEQRCNSINVNEFFCMY